ncbi:hypothetical protein KAU32_11250 [bacterium]|nr:hypothetical protein [bacterium]
MSESQLQSNITLLTGELRDKLCQLCQPPSPYLVPISGCGDIGKKEKGKKGNGKMGKGKRGTEREDQKMEPEIFHTDSLSF